MSNLAKNKTQPNWLLRGLIAVSLAIHGLIFLHVTGLYNSKALTYIELTMRDMSKPPTRSIPRPRYRPRTPPVQEVKRLNVVQRRIPRLKPIKMEPPEKDLPDSLVEGIGMPDIPDTPSLAVVDWSSGTLVDEAGGDFVNAQNYLDMVRLKIERHKKYPAAARSRSIEGHVIIRFVITQEGAVRDIKVTKRSRNRHLDLAAVKAVEDAAPFSRPPRRFFQGDIPLELTIVFELT
jgi:protein TonB